MEATLYTVAPRATIFGLFVLANFTICECG